jgi:hypothetical protein
MDSNTIMAISAVVVSVAGSILTVINHKRIRSNCCGAQLVAAIDIENTSPPKIERQLTIKV